jgi:hypothetical protein
MQTYVADMLHISDFDRLQQAVFRGAPVHDRRRDRSPTPSGRLEAIKAGAVLRRPQERQALIGFQSPAVEFCLMLRRLIPTVK